MTSLGVTQNFLTDSGLVRSLLTKTDISQPDTVLDIGAGKGVLTAELAKVAKKVTAIELDGNLLFELNNRFSGVPNIEIVNGNFLDLPLPSTPYKVFANIPFNITSRIVNKLLFSKNPPISAYLILQKEAAYRFMGVGEGYMISTLIKPFYALKILFDFEPADFDPVPRVDIVLLEFKKLQSPLIKNQDVASFYDFVSYVCLQQKPSLKYRINKLFTNEQFKRLCKDLAISDSTTIKDLNISQWCAIFAVFNSYVPTEKKLLTRGSFVMYIKTLEKAPIGSRTKIRL